MNGVRDGRMPALSACLAMLMLLMAALIHGVAKLASDRDPIFVGPSVKSFRESRRNTVKKASRCSRIVA